MESYNKLVRDKIPEMLDKKEIPYEKRIANQEEFRFELIEKLKEEVKEFLEDESPEELADVLEVIEAIKSLPEYKEVEDIRKKKKDERGGFEKKIILKGKYQ